MPGGESGPPPGQQDAASLAPLHHPSASHGAVILQIAARRQLAGTTFPATARMRLPSPPPFCLRITCRNTRCISRRALALPLTLALIALVGCNDAHPGLEPRNAALREAPVVLYPAADGTRPPRAIVFFIGNDVGFWQPHQALAWSLSREQFAVAGFDLRPLLRSLPVDATAREKVVADRLSRYIELARRELDVQGSRSMPSSAPEPSADRTDSSAPLRRSAVPLILAGHSIGSELALWAAAHLRRDDLVGVLAMSPGNRSHLEISASDLLLTDEPTGPGSFSVAEQVARLSTGARVAIVRGERDKLADADPKLLAAGGEMARRWVVPFAGHSLKSRLLGTHYTLAALDWLLARTSSALPATAVAAATESRTWDERGPGAVDGRCAVPRPEEVRSAATAKGRQ